MEGPPNLLAQDPAVALQRPATGKPVRLAGCLMACPPGNCAAWGAFRLCKPLPPIVIDGSYSPDELQLLWFCWRARSTGEYGGNTPVDLGFDTPGLIDISKTTNIAKIIAYCDSRGTLVRQFTNFSRFGVKFNSPNYKASGSFSTWSGGIFGGATSPGGGGGDVIVGTGSGGDAGGGGAATCPCTPDSGTDLTVVVCTELDCDGADPKIEITVCGGTPPYSWSISGGEGAVETQSGANNRNVVVVPAVSATVAGIAYHHGFEVTFFATGCAQPDKQFAFPIGCEGESEGACAETAFGGGVFEITCQDRPDEPGFECGFDVSTVGNHCVDCPTRSGVHDVRTAQMITDGCIPCGLSMDGLNITVEDDVGDTVVTVISL